MNHFFSRFYFLSKFTTSLILLILLIFLSYLFFKSYLDQKTSDSSDLKIEGLTDQIYKLTNIVKQNSKNLNIVKGFVEENKKSVKNISINLETFNKKNINQNLLLQIEKLSEENKKLEKEFYNISSSIKDFDKLQQIIPKNKKKSSSVKNIINLIRLKLDNGSNFSEEVQLLKDLNDEESFISNVEKLSIYANENFLGLDELNSNFDYISSQYLSDYYLKKNNINLIKYFYNLVLIQPNLTDNIRDENVLLLSMAKQNLLDRNLKESIKQIKKLNDGEYFFSTWIKEAMYYYNVTNLLNKI